MNHPLFDIVLSGLDRVIAVGRTVENAGIAVELTAVEVRQAGAIAYWRARPSEELLAIYADVRVTDDRGTVYTAREAAHDGSALYWAGQSVFFPSPPSGARLVVEILSFGPPIDHEVPRGVSRQHIRGPWRFTVDA